MTQTGKCDTCRQRKVKCDEERPKCGACRKKDRPCVYSYGKASTFVVQDPNQLTKHGKSRTTPITWALDSSVDLTSSPGSSSSDLQITSGRPAGNGHGYFQTLAPKSKARVASSKRKIAHQKKMFEAHLKCLQEESGLSMVRPFSPEDALIARYINMLGSYAPEKQPLSILGTWIQSIPSRIGSNHMLDLAAEFLVNSYSTYWDNTHSKRKLARASKAKALHELQLVVLEAQSAPTYEILLATKMHYAAEALMGIDSMYHAIHAFGLAELLKSGAVTNVDDEHYWNLIDNTYIDDVNEAILAGRVSVYDNEFYLSATYPPALNDEYIQLSPAQRASMAIMHIFVQCPRLVCLIRNAVTNPDDADALATAVSHLESIMQIDLAQHVRGLVKTSVTVVPIPPAPDMIDIMPDSLEYDSVQNNILITRYWMLENALCGMADTLHRHFPAEMALSMLPDRDRLREIDTSAAYHQAKSLLWADANSSRLPLVKLRLHTPLQISIGAWYRTIRYLTSPSAPPNPSYAAELARARRMKAWLVAECNKIHLEWNVSAVEEKPLLEALDTMAGEKIPDWLPIRVRFEAEDGEMVMKLDYENRTGSYSESINLKERERKAQERARKNPFEAGEEWQRERLGVQELPLRPANGKEWQRPADFIHSTGRNLCSTSGWWPESETTSTVLLDSTHKTSAFSRIARRQPLPAPAPSPSAEQDAYGSISGHPCLASSWWPQSPTSLGGRDSSRSTSNELGDWDTTGTEELLDFV